MSYRPIILYGYEIIVLYDMDLPHTIKMIYDLNSTINAPFEMKCIIPCFPATFDQVEGYCLSVSTTPSIGFDNTQAVPNPSSLLILTFAAFAAIKRRK